MVNFVCCLLLHIVSLWRILVKRIMKMPDQPPLKIHAQSFVLGVITIVIVKDLHNEAI